MPSAPSSRLLQHEQRRLLKQTVLYVVGGIVILILFVAVLMPAAIRLFFKAIDGNKTPGLTDTLPPQVPVLSLPYQATNSATIALTGFGEANSKVSLVVNSSPVATVDVGGDGQFKQDLRLEKGDNDLVVYGTDAAGNESAQSAPYHVFMDDEPLKIDISEPTSPAQVVGKKNQQLLIKGKTKPNTKVYVNDRLNTVKEDGSFEILQPLAEGDNTLKVRGVDKAGNTVELELQVNFKL
jgi:hypothetical protein